MYIGIDLGTSNAALSHGDQTKIQVLDIRQVVAPHEVSARKTLPAALYLLTDQDQEQLATSLESLGLGSTSAGGEERRRSPLLGTYARAVASEKPDRVVLSAKSWLCMPQVNREDGILPWQSSVEHKLSPVKASELVLDYLWRAFKDSHVDAMPEATVVTIPASFDDVARQLTHRAAEAAGLPNLHLLEEPVAALYAWVYQHEENWRKTLTPGDIVLVCDVGGGTTDFSLVLVDELQGMLALSRISVGNHLILGGDNMDLTLAHHLRARLASEGQSLDQWQLISLTNAVRSAKEQLLTDETLSELPIAIAGKGSSLFAQVVSTKLTRSDVSSVLVDGFFPETGLEDQVVRRQAAGVRQFGLQYESDPAITRHLGQFLKNSYSKLAASHEMHHLKDRFAAEQVILPHKVLFNGGVFKAPVFRERILKILRQWSELCHKPAPQEMDAVDLDLAVALGACYYGRIKSSGEGLRIKAGTTQSYYLGIEPSVPTVPGFEMPVDGLCVVAMGAEEGQGQRIGSSFGAIVGQEVEFTLYASDLRPDDTAGGVVNDAPSHLNEVGTLTTVLDGEGYQVGELIQVVLFARVTEVGLLEIDVEDCNRKMNWQLKYNLRNL